MWSGFDPQVRRDLEYLRQAVARQHQNPTHEWPLAFEHAQDQLLVVREWPDGSLTAYLTPDADSARHERS